ncbi:MAG: hypothetical protein AAF675_02175 [Pseudomonadota bacterium]
MGDGQDLIQAENGGLTLDPDRFLTSMEGADGDLELFEDLEIRDREFENWIRDQRLRASPKEQEPPAPRPPRGMPIMLLSSGPSDQPQANRLVHDLENAIARAVLEQTDIAVFGNQSWEEDSALAATGVAVRLSAGWSNGEWVVSTRITKLSDSGVVWVARRHLTGETHEAVEDRAGRQLINEIVSRVLADVAQQRVEGTGQKAAFALAAEARSLIFRLGRDDLRRADSLLQSAYEQEPRANYLAWRSFLRNTAVFEHLTTEFLGPDQPASTFAEEAYRQDPDDPTVLAFAAQSHLVGDGNAGACRWLAEDAVARDPSQPLGWAFLANAQLVAGDYAAARATAARAAETAAGLRGAQFFRIFGCMAAVGVGEYDAAFDDAAQALAFLPGFRAPMRYMIAIDAARGRRAEAQKLTERLAHHEPGFNFEKLLAPSYPVQTLQKLPIIEDVQRFADREKLG